MVGFDLGLILSFDSHHGYDWCLVGFFSGAFVGFAGGGGGGFYGVLFPVVGWVLFTVVVAGFLWQMW